MKRRLIFPALVGLLFGLVTLALWLSPRPTSLGPTNLSPSALGPIGATFNVPIRSDSLAGHFILFPDVSGHLAVNGNQLQFRPVAPFEYGQSYSVTLKAGIRGQNLLPMLRDVSWTFRVGEPRLLYLREDGGRSNMWLVESPYTNAGNARQLTGEPLDVWDYSPLPDGLGVLISSLNPNGSMDLILVDLAGEHRELLACPEAVCRDALWQPSGSLVAYLRQSLEPAGSQPQVWLLDTETGSTEPARDPALLAEAGIDTLSSVDPRWSADGRYLSYFKPDARVIVVADLEGGQPLLIPANLETMGSWSPAGYQLAYTELAFGDTRPHEHVDAGGNVIAHEGTGLYSHTVVAGLGQDRAVDLAAGLEVDDSRPTWHPEGETLAVGRTLTGAGRQIWLLPVKVETTGGSAVAMTADPLANHTALAWSPDGRLLAFMRVDLANGGGEPAVWLMDVNNGDMTEVEQGAFLPGWLP